MSDPIVIIVDADARRAQSEFGKVNSSMEYLAEAAERAARGANRAFQSMFQNASQNARAELQELARIYQERVQMAYSEARASVAAIEQKKRAVDEALREEVRALEAGRKEYDRAQAARVRSLQEAQARGQALLQERAAAVRESAAAEIRAAEDAKVQKLAKLREEYDTMRRMAKDAFRAGEYGSGPGATAQLQDIIRQSGKLYDAQRQKVEEATAAAIKAAEQRRDATLRVDQDSFDKFKRLTDQRIGESQRTTKDAIQQAEQRAAGEQSTLDRTLGFIRRFFAEKKRDADKDFSDAAKRLQMAEEQALSFGRIFGANFFGDLAARALTSLVRSIRDYIKDATLYAARTEELGIALHAVAKANNVATASVDAQEESIKRLNITTQDTRQVLARFVAAQFDVTKANKLAVVAQDLAVIAGRTTAEEFEKLNDAIQTLQTRNLRSAGVFLTVDQVLDTLAKTTGRARNSFTTLEKQTAVLNAVLEYGARVTGTYDAAMTTALKQMRSTERFLYELQNAFGSLFTGILYGIVTVLNPMLDYLSKNRAVFIALAATVTIFGLTVVAAATRTVPALTAITLSFKVAALAVYDYDRALKIANATSLTATRMAGILSLVALFATLVIAIGSAIGGTKELTGANERLVDQLLASQKQIAADVDFFEKRRQALGENAEMYEKNAEIQDRYSASLQQLEPLQAAQIEMLGTMKEKVDAVTGALRNQQTAIAAQLNEQKEAASAAVIAQIEKQGQIYKNVSDAIQALPEAQRRLVESQSEVNYAIDDANPPTQRATLHLRELKETIISGSQAYAEAREAIQKFASPLAQIAVKQEELAGRTVNSKEQAAALARQIVENSEVLKGNAFAQGLVATQVQIVIQRMIEEKNRFKEAGGAALELVEALNALKIAQLDVEKTPSGAARLAKETSDSINQMYEDIRKNAAPKESGPGGEGLATTIARDLGVSVEDLQKNKELQDRYIAALQQTRLRAVFESAKSIQSVLGPEGYQKFLETDAGKLIKHLGDVAAEGLRIQADVRDPFSGISKSGKVAATEVEKLADQIKRVEAETALLAKGGTSDDLDRARLRRAESERDRVRSVYERRFELGVQVGEPIDRSREALDAADRYLDRLDSIRKLRSELNLPVAVRLPDTDEAARLEEERLEKIRDVRGDLLQLMDAESEARRQLLVLQLGQSIPTVDLETRAQIKYLEALRDRREAEQDLTADLAVELRRRADMQADAAAENERIAGQFLLDRLQDQRKAYEDFQREVLRATVNAGGEQALADVPLIRRALSEARNLSQASRNPAVRSIDQTNEILRTNIAAKLEQLITNTAGGIRVTVTDGKGGAAGPPAPPTPYERAVDSLLQQIEESARNSKPTAALRIPTDAQLEMISRGQGGQIEWEPDERAAFFEFFGTATGRGIEDFFNNPAMEGELKRIVHEAAEKFLRNPKPQEGPAPGTFFERDGKLLHSGGGDPESRLIDRIQKVLGLRSFAGSPPQNYSRAGGGLLAQYNTQDENNRIEKLRQRLELDQEIFEVMKGQRAETFRLEEARRILDRRWKVEVTQLEENVTLQMELVRLQDRSVDLVGAAFARQEILQEQQNGRLRDEIEIRRRLIALRADEAGGYLTKPDFDRRVRDQAEVQRREGFENTARRIIELEEEIGHASEGAAGRYREAWLSAIRDVQTRDEEAVKRQLAARAELEDATVFHVEQMRADVMEFLASQTTMTEGVADAWKALYTSAIEPFDRAIDRLTAKMGVFGDVAGSILKAVGRQILNSVIGRLLDYTNPSKVDTREATAAITGPKAGGTTAGAATAAFNVALGSLQGGVAGMGLPGAGGRSIGMSQMTVNASLVIVNGGTVMGGGGGGGLSGLTTGGGGGLLNFLSSPQSAGQPGSAYSIGPGGQVFFNPAGARGPGGSAIRLPLPYLGGGAGSPAAVNPTGGGAGGGRFGMFSGPLSALTTGGAGDVSFPRGMTSDPYFGLGPPPPMAGGGRPGDPGFMPKQGGFFSGLGNQLAAAAPMLGLSLGSSLGGPSILGQVLGGGGGLLAGGVLAAMFAPGALTGLGLSGAFVGGLAAAAPFLLPIAGALLIGSYFIGRSKQRRKDEQLRTQILTDAKSRINQLVAAVKGDRMDGEDALLQAAQIRGEYLQQVGQIKDKKTRRIAEETVRELDYLINNVLKPAVAEQANRKEFVNQFVPTYDLGGRAERGPAPARSVPDVTGYGLLPGGYKGRDTIIAAVAEGETILTPRDVAALGGRNRMRQIGVRGYASGGVAGSVAPAASVAPSQGWGGGSAPVVVYAITVYSREDAEKLARLLPNAVIAEKIYENVEQTGGAGLPAFFMENYQGSY